MAAPGSNMIEIRSLVKQFGGVHGGGRGRT